MLPKIVNLTLQLVVYEIENVLHDYLNHPYQVIFSNQELRQKLILHILAQTPNYYAIIENSEELPKDPRVLYRSFEERVAMEILIRESITCIYQENGNLIDYHVHQ